MTEKRPDTPQTGLNSSSRHLLQVRNLDAGYGMVQVLFDISVHMDEGEFVVLIGPNGSGKSTLMKAMIGVIRPSSGQVLFQGEEITGRSPADVLDLGIGYVPQIENVFPDLTVRENLVMGGYTVGGDLRGPIQSVCELFPKLSNLMSQQAGDLSGGERQMVAMARAMMVDPDVLILDEPTAGLQPSLVSDVLDRVLRLNREQGITILMGTQTNEAIPRADRGILLRAGEVVRAETTDRLMESQDVQKLYFGGE